MTKQLYKSKSNVKIDGICAGVAEYLNIDPTIVRLIWVIAGFTSVGVIAYIICMFVIPREPHVQDYTHQDRTYYN